MAMLQWCLFCKTNWHLEFGLQVRVCNDWSGAKTVVMYGMLIVHTHTPTHTHIKSYVASIEKGWEGGMRVMRVIVI